MPQISISNSDPVDIARAIVALNSKTPDLATARQRGIERAAIITENYRRLSGVLNANTVSTDLKRTVALQTMVRAFATPLAVLKAFSTSFAAVRLDGTDKAAVPYFPLATAASTDWNATNGYVMAEDANSDAKVITVDRRKYQPLAASSSEIARQPFLNLAQGMEMKAEKLSVDVVTDILSAITAENYGAAGCTEPASSFDSDDVIGLKGVADEAGWPSVGRSLTVNSSYDVALLKDASIKAAADFGRATIQDGKVLKLLGFDYYTCPTLPTNSQNLGGFISYPSALLIAFAPVTPADSVRDRLSRYELFTDPTTGLSLEYRAWGDPDFDKAKEVMECNYGFEVGEAAALKRIAAE